MSAWIESHQTLRDHPKKDALVEALFTGSVPDDIADYAAVGLLQHLWWWALDYAQDGDLSAFSDRQIAKACRWQGDPRVLVEALTSAGFLHDGILNDWHDYAGKLIARRAKNRERMQQARSEPVQSTCAARAPHVQSDQQRTCEATEPNPTKENQDQEHVSAAPAANATDEYPEDFEQFWSAYPPQRRREKRKAFRAWTARRKGGETAERMIAAARHFATATRGQEGRYVKLPATFVGPDRPYEEWVAGVPPGGNGNAPATNSFADELTDEDRDFFTVTER